MNKGEIQQTPEQQSLAKLAQSRMSDYQSRWLPLQQRLAGTLTAMGQQGSTERQMAAGRAVGDVNAQEAQRQEALAAQESQRGTAASGAFKEALNTNMNQRTAAAGMGTASANRQIDEAYLSGLQSLMTAGKPLQQSAIGGMSGAAGVAAERAFGNAEVSSMNASRLAGTLGTGVGMGLSYMANQPKNPTTGPDISNADMNNQAYINAGATP